MLGAALLPGGKCALMRERGEGRGLESGPKWRRSSPSGMRISCVGPLGLPDGGFWFMFVTWAFALNLCRGGGHGEPSR